VAGLPVLKAEGGEANFVSSEKEYRRSGYITRNAMTGNRRVGKTNSLGVREGRNGEKVFLD